MSKPDKISIIEDSVFNLYILSQFMEEYQAPEFMTNQSFKCYIALTDTPDSLGEKVSKDSTLRKRIKNQDLNLQISVYTNVDSQCYIAHPLNPSKEFSQMEAVELLTYIAMVDKHVNDSCSINYYSKDSLSSKEMCFDDKVNYTQVKMDKNGIQESRMQVSLESMRYKDNLQKKYSQYQTDLSPRIEQYIEERKSRADKYSYIPDAFRKFTKAEKLDAAEQLIKAMNFEGVMINKRQVEALKNGRLNEAFEGIRAPLEKKLSDIGYETIIGNSVEDMVQALNKSNKQWIESNPKQALVNQLIHYKSLRINEDSSYHWRLFKSAQFSKNDKIEACDALIAILENNSKTITEAQKKALKQGRLGNTIKQFLKNYESELGEVLYAENGNPNSEIYTKISSLEMIISLYGVDINASASSQNIGK